MPGYTLAFCKCMLKSKRYRKTKIYILYLLAIMKRIHNYVHCIYLH